MLIQVVPRVVPVMLVVGVMACLSTSQQVMTNDLICDGSQCHCYVVSVSGGVTRYDSQWWTWQLSPGVKSQSTGCRMAPPPRHVVPDFKVIKSTFYICQRGNCIRYD